MSSCRRARLIDVLFDDFMADDMATVERIYDVAGQPFTDDVRTRHGRPSWSSHPRGRNGTVVYQPEVLGIDRGRATRALAFYRTRFGVEDDGPVG